MSKNAELSQIEGKIKESFSQIEHPVYKRSLSELQAFGKLEQEGEKLRLFVRVPSEDKKTQIDLEAKIRAGLKGLELPGKLKIRFEVDSQMEIDTSKKVPGIKNVLAVASGKGGVGKSTVSANLALSLSEAGHKVGLMDADIYGPSIGKMFGLLGKQSLSGTSPNSIRPFEKHGIKLISFSFLLEQDQAVVWRGPMLGKAVEQFLFQVEWGELDYLIVDLPPGTGDVQMSLAQMIDLDGAIIVTTPQNVALQDASRAVNMFLQLKVPILGVIENMSFFECPNCQHVTHIFSKNGGEFMASRYHVPLLGSVPLQPAIMEAGESGKPAVLSEVAPGLSKVFLDMHDPIQKQIERYR